MPYMPGKEVGCMITPARRSTGGEGNMVVYPSTTGSPGSGGGKREGGGSVGLRRVVKKSRARGKPGVPGETRWKTRSRRGLSGAVRRARTSRWRAFHHGLVCMGRKNKIAGLGGVRTAPRWPRAATQPRVTRRFEASASQQRKSKIAHAPVLGAAIVRTARVNLGLPVTRARRPSADGARGTA